MRFFETYVLISSSNIVRIKVTKLDRDAGSGTSLQEMTFWLNLERALQKIAQKRESDEVTLTLEALKCGKRFHATVSFDADTGCYAYEKCVSLVIDNKGFIIYM